MSFAFIYFAFEGSSDLKLQKVFAGAACVWGVQTPQAASLYVNRLLEPLRVFKEETERQEIKKVF